MIIFNFIGLAMAIVSFGVAFAVGPLLGIRGEGPLMMIAGPLLAIIDGIYRWKHSTGHWLHPNQGGSLFFLPAWILGVVWFVLGIVYSVQSQT